MQRYAAKACKAGWPQPSGNRRLAAGGERLPVAGGCRHPPEIDHQHPATEQLCAATGAGDGCGLPTMATGMSQALLLPERAVGLDSRAPSELTGVHGRPPACDQLASSHVSSPRSRTPGPRHVSCGKWQTANGAPRCTAGRFQCRASAPGDRREGGRPTSTSFPHLRPPCAPVRPRRARA